VFIVGLNTKVFTCRIQFLGQSFAYCFKSDNPNG